MCRRSSGKSADRNDYSPGRAERKRSPAVPCRCAGRLLQFRALKYQTRLTSISTSAGLTATDERAAALLVGEAAPLGGEEPANAARTPWRIAPSPFPLSPAAVAELEQMGDDLLAFYMAANRLYGSAARGRAPDWVLDCLDQGKPERVRELGRLRRYRSALPIMIRPDLMALDDGGFVATELDAVPGGFGVLGAISRAYQNLGFEPIGGADGIVRGLADALRGAAGADDPTVALVVADESEDYRPEMDWAATALRESGLRTSQIHPRELRLHDESLQMRNCDGWEAVDVVYRFLELHDLPNIPKIDLVIYAMKHRMAKVTAPFKSYLEEKLLFYLFHHPELDAFWRDALGKRTQSRLARLLPPTWLLDPKPIPPTAAVDPPLFAGTRRIRNWDDLRGLSQRERRLVLKPSGFSELAWGSRGVTIGHDVNQEVWDAAVGSALASFEKTPYILQHFHQSRRVRVSYYDVEADAVRPMTGRARISPYYMVVNGKARLSGILVTVVPAANKVIHGTSEAVMMPAMLSDEAEI